LNADRPAARNTFPFPSTEDKERERRLKREAVLRTASSMFCERGYMATQMDDVARELGVSKPTIYYYFKNKEDVLLACFEVGFKLINSTLRDTKHADNNGDRLRRVLESYAQIMMQDFGRCTVRVPSADLSEGSRKRVARHRRALDDKIRALFREAITDGSIRDCDPRIATFTILGSLNWIGHWHRPDGPMSVTDVAAAVVDQLFMGLKA
jgi:AcrR family transcriptional regulator